MNTMNLRRLLYAFKRDWGTIIDYVQIIKSDADDSTGKRSVEKLVYQIPVVFLPQDTMRKFIQDIGYLAANKNFTYGALNDYTKLSVIINRFDLPPGFDLNLNGYFNRGNKRYERVSIENVQDVAYIMTAQGVEGAPPTARYKEVACQGLSLQQGVIYELN